jgi:hypothetical protein
MPLQEISTGRSANTLQRTSKEQKEEHVPASKAHVTSKALERLNISVCLGMVSYIVERLAKQVQLRLEKVVDSRVRICLSRCSSLVKDCPQ